MVSIVMVPLPEIAERFAALNAVELNGIEGEGSVILTTIMER
jgi:hypothetical protein